MIQLEFVPTIRDLCVLSLVTGCLGWGHRPERPVLRDASTCFRRCLELMGERGRWYSIPGSPLMHQLVSDFVFVSFMGFCSLKIVIQMATYLAPILAGEFLSERTADISLFVATASLP